MIVKFFKHGKGSESENPAASITKALNYLMGSHDADGNLRSVDPVWLRGDAENMRQIVGYGNHSGSYTSGALRFVEDLDDDQVHSIIDDFERALLPGLDTSQYVSNWVMHKDKGGTELHFLVAGEELETGKRLNAYYHEKDRHRLYYWRRAMDAEHGFADPDDPSRVRPVKSHHDLPAGKAEVIERLDNFMLSLAQQGIVKNRDDVKRVINEIEGLEITRENKNSISVKTEGKQPFRLKGSIFAEDFRPNKLMGKYLERKSQEYKGKAQERARESRKRFEELHAKRTEYYQKRYKKNFSIENISPDIRDFVSINTRNNIGLSSDHSNAELYYRKETPEPARPDTLPTKRGIERAISMQTEITTTKKIEDYINERAEPVRPRDFKFYEKVLNGVQEARRSANGFIKESVRASVGLAKRARERTAELLGNVEKLRSDGSQLQHNGEKIQAAIRRESGIKGELGKLEFNIEQVRRNKHKVDFKC